MTISMLFGHSALPEPLHFSGGESTGCTTLGVGGTLNFIQFLGCHLLAGRIVVRAEKYKVAKVTRRKPEMYSKTAKEQNMATLVFG